MALLSVSRAEEQAFLWIALKKAGWKEKRDKAAAMSSFEGIGWYTRYGRMWRLVGLSNGRDLSMLTG